MRLLDFDSMSFIFFTGPASKSMPPLNISENIDMSSSNSDSPPWIVKLGTRHIRETDMDFRYHFLLEKEGYVLSRYGGAFLNVISEGEYAIRGHSSRTSYNKKAAGREYGAQFEFELVPRDEIAKSLKEEEKDNAIAEEMNKKNIAMIQRFPPAKGKRIISFGLYGSGEKYTRGAIRNVELQPTYFPGWICRFYCTSDVPEDVVSALRSKGAEIIPIPDGMGYAAGMFWRFMPAGDSTIERFIVRDVDSRLNARDRYLTSNCCAHCDVFRDDMM